MKILFFHVEVQDGQEEVHDVLDRVRRLALPNREKHLEEKFMLLETCDLDGDLWQLDFTQRRVRNGPGHSRHGELTTDFELEEDAGFGEQTAAVLSDGHMAVQYNHYGVRPGAIALYLSSFALNRVSVSPVLDEDAFARLVNSQVQSKLVCSFDAAAITESMADHIAVGEMLRLRREMGAGRIEMTLSYGQDRPGGRLQGVPEFARSLLQTAGLRGLKVNIKENVDTATEVLNLLEQNHAVVVPDGNLTMTDGRRYDYESRIREVRREFERWRE